jgi:glucosamine--fructose-6-phosphate aminotransferase (isomerizing)
MSLHSEICEQAEVIERLLVNQMETIQGIAQKIREYAPHYVFLAARGTSDNAGRYASYLWGSLNGLPVALATPSLFTYYEKPPKLNRALVLGISQSGASPDILSVLDEGRRQGCKTMAITNRLDSPLVDAADFVIDIQAGVEEAVAATKTYTAELMAIAMLSVAMNGETNGLQALHLVSGWIRDMLNLETKIERIAERYRYMSHCVVIGRGYNYATAFEWSLKLKELAYVIAEPYSSADFRHGPIAMIDSGFPVMVVNPRGKVFADILALMMSLKNEQHAELLVISDHIQALSIAQSPLQIPQEIPEWLTPLIAIIPAQLFVYHLTRSKGFDTEQPRSIHKVTETH